MLIRLIGSVIYQLTKNVSFHFLLKKKYSDPIEKLRTFSLVLQGAKIGKGSIVRKGVFVAFPKNLILGDNVTIGFRSRFYNYSLVKVGNNSELGPHLHVQTNDHIWNDPNKPLGKQGTFSKKVVIGDGVFIGSNVTILEGINIEKLSVVGAGSVVNKDLEQGYLYCGVPARKIKKLTFKNKNI